MASHSIICGGNVNDTNKRMHYWCIIMQIYWHHEVLTRWWSRSCIAGTPSLSAKLTILRSIWIVLEYAKEKSHKKLHEQFWLFNAKYFLSVCEWHCSGWKDWCWTTENVGQNMQLIPICFVNTMAPSLKAPYTILANCIFTPLPRDCNHWLQSILANFQIWLLPSARPVQNLHTFGEGSWQMLVSSLIACSQKRVIKSIELT